MSANVVTVPLHKCLVCARPVEKVPGTEDCWRHVGGKRTHHIPMPAPARPTWKGIEMKPGYAVCANCEHPIRPAPDGRGKHVWVHIEALPRCYDPLPLRQQGLEKLVGPSDFAYRFSAEANASLFIDKPKPPSERIPQGCCDTTSTPRFENPNCKCPTYEGNLGPCATFLEGSQPGHCVYCDHLKECHPKTEPARDGAWVCELPPAGWRCTRPKGHHGPCAAIPTQGSQDAFPSKEWARKAADKEAQHTGDIGAGTPTPANESARQTQQARASIETLLDHIDQNSDLSALPLDAGPGKCLICNDYITTYQSYGVYPGGRMHWNCLREEAEKVSTPPTPWYKSPWYWLVTVGCALVGQSYFWRWLLG